MKTSIRKQSLVAAATLALLGLAGNALAARPSDVPTVRVRYGDLDLASDTGVQALYARLRSAARQVCSDDGTRRSLRQLAVVRACFDTSLANAVAASHNDRLAALHLQKEGRLNSRIALNAAVTHDE